MFDLQAFVGIIAAYPVHIMTLVGCVLLFFLVLPRRKRRYKPSLKLNPAAVNRKELTPDEKKILAQKVREGGIETLKTSFSHRTALKYIIPATISFLVPLTLLFFNTTGFIVLTLLFLGFGLAGWLNQRKKTVR